MRLSSNPVAASSTPSPDGRHLRVAPQAPELAGIRLRPCNRTKAGAKVPHLHIM